MTAYEDAQAIGTLVALDDLLDLTAVAELFEVNKGTVQKWRTRGILPPPDVELAMGPIWVRATVEQWGLATWPRRLVEDRVTGTITPRR
jgi:hypothetical protein